MKRGADAGDSGKRLIRTRARVFAALATASTLLLVALPSHVGSATAYTFTGSVSASGTTRRTHSFPVSSPAKISTTLDWTRTWANLDLLLKDPSGTIVAGATTTGRPETLSHSAGVSGTWKIVVKAVKGSSSYTAAVSVAAAVVNSAPLVADDAASVSARSSVSIPVLTNDSDPNSGQTLSVGAVTQGANGTVSVSGDRKKAVYTPAGGFTGSDSFTYQACDNGSPKLCSYAAVNVTVTNAAPSAADDEASTPLATPVTISVLLNDSDPDPGQRLSVASATQAGSGAVTITTDRKKVTYAPGDGFIGTDSFTYEACDNASPSLCSQAIVTVRVNTPPVASRDFAVTEARTPVTIDVLANDSDPDPGQTLTLTAFTQAAHGSVTAAADQPGLVYTPEAGFSGPDSFTYTVCDDAAEPVCSQTTVDLKVTYRFLRIWAPEDMGSNHRLVTENQAIEHALRFEHINANRLKYVGRVAAMKAANPHLRLLVYMNGTFAVPSTLPPEADESWFAHDANGNRIYNIPWPSLYLMDVSNPDWVSNRVQLCKSWMESTGYDGCEVDNLGIAPLSPKYVSSLPVNPATGQVWTRPDWLRATSHIAASIKAFVSPAPVFGNGLETGASYFDPAAPSRQLLHPQMLSPEDARPGLDGAMPEAWLRSAGQGISVHRSEAAWKKDVDMLADAGASGKSVIAITKVWVSGTAEQKDAWHRYALASFLLGNDGNSYFFFTYDQLSDPMTRHPFWNIELGEPLGPYDKIDGVYQRAFSGGRVLVNPTSETYTVALGAGYRDLRGRVVDSVTLGPHTGEVLIQSTTV